MRYEGTNILILSGRVTNAGSVTQRGDFAVLEFELTRDRFRPSAQGYSEDTFGVSVQGYALDKLPSRPREGEIWMIHGEVASSPMRNGGFFTRIVGKKLERLHALEVGPAQTGPNFDKPGIPSELLGQEDTPF